MMMGFDLILVVLVLVGAVAYANGWRPQFSQLGPASSRPTPFEILKARYARGEITREEFDQMRQDLES